MPTATRVFNFSAGPAVLPIPVLEEAQRDLIALPGVGMSVMEISHRSATFEDVLHRAQDDIRTLARVPANYKILMLQGGASLQFSMVPMNLLGAGATADYIDSGSWADKAIKEAKKVGKVNVAATTKAENYSRVPRQDELTLTPGAAYVHMTSNNTIEGTEYQELPPLATSRWSATHRPTCSAGRSTSPVTPSSTPARRRTWARPASQSSSFARICWRARPRRRPRCRRC